MRASLSASGDYATVEASAAELREVLVTSAIFGDAAWEDDVLADVIAELDDGRRAERRDHRP